MIKSLVLLSACIFACDMKTTFVGPSSARCKPAMLMSQQGRPEVSRSLSAEVPKMGQKFRWDTHHCLSNRSALFMSWSFFRKQSESLKLPRGMIWVRSSIMQGVGYLRPVTVWHHCRLSRISCWQPLLSSLVTYSQACNKQGPTDTEFNAGRQATRNKIMT